MGKVLGSESLGFNRLKCSGCRVLGIQYRVRFSGYDEGLGIRISRIMGWLEDSEEEIKRQKYGRAYKGRS